MLTVVNSVRFQISKREFMSRKKWWDKLCSKKIFPMIVLFIYMSVIPAVSSLTAGFMKPAVNNISECPHIFQCPMRVSEAPHPSHLKTITVSPGGHLGNHLYTKHRNFRNRDPSSQQSNPKTHSRAQIMIVSCKP